MRINLSETRVEAKRLFEIWRDCEDRLQRGAPRIKVEKAPQGRLSRAESEALGCADEKELDEEWFRKRWIETTKNFRDLVAKAYHDKILEISKGAL